jgi:hypothetical protein
MQVRDYCITKGSLTGGLRIAVKRRVPTHLAITSKEQGAYL